MKRITSLILAFVALAVLVFSFISNQGKAQFFGLEVNVWFYRLVWASVGVASFWDYRKNLKK